MMESLLRHILFLNIYNYKKASALANKIGVKNIFSNIHPMTAGCLGGGGGGAKFNRTKGVKVLLC